MQSWPPLTVDGNHPLCGREVVFTLGVLTVRDATHEEMKAGGAIGAAPNIDASAMRPVRAAVSEAGLVIELGNPDFQK
jgi:FKBP-type peptidyl-prolyl cis-trans isomerase 2